MGNGFYLSHRRFIDRLDNYEERCGVYNALTIYEEIDADSFFSFFFFAGCALWWEVRYLYCVMILI